MAYRGVWRMRGRGAWHDRPDTPAIIQDRLNSRTASELGVADRIAKYPVLTADNAKEAIDYQTERCKFHYNELKLKG
jgi:hypothetical protein